MSYPHLKIDLRIFWENVAPILVINIVSQFVFTYFNLRLLDLKQMKTIMKCFQGYENPAFSCFTCRCQNKMQAVTVRIFYKI